MKNSIKQQKKGKNMVTKIGYGFRANDLATENNEQILLSFIQKYDYNLYLEIKEEMYSNKGKYCLDIILYCISQDYTTFAEYIQNIINTEERKFANLNKDDMVLQLCDNFLVYIPNIFIKDNKAVIASNIM